jgi:hypothetical protein
MCTSAFVVGDTDGEMKCGFQIELRSTVDLTASDFKAVTRGQQKRAAQRWTAPFSNMVGL